MVTRWPLSLFIVFVDEKNLIFLREAAHEHTVPIAPNPIPLSMSTYSASQAYSSSQKPMQSVYIYTVISTVSAEGRGRDPAGNPEKLFGHTHREARERRRYYECTPRAPPANHSLPMSSLAPGYTSFAVFPSAVALYSKGQIAVPRGAQLFSCRGLYTQERGYASESSLQRSRKKHVLFLFFRACRSR